MRAFEKKLDKKNKYIKEMAGIYSPPNLGRIPQTATDKYLQAKSQSTQQHGVGAWVVKKYFNANGQLYYITANGDRLDDRKYTLAFNNLPLGTSVSVTNLDNGKSTGAVINDTGGFESLGRIADLSVATFNAIGAETDKTLVEIKQINN